MRQVTIDQPITAVHERVRTAAASQGWLTASGGSAHGPSTALLFRRGLGSFRPADGMSVELTQLDANRTQVGVTVWRGTAEVEGYDVDRLLRAIGAPPG